MWIEIHDNLPDHPKVVSLSAALAVDRDTMVGKLVRLWTWALTKRPSGDFSRHDAQTIAEHMRWTKGRPERLVDAMVENGLLDKTESGYHIHDWEEHVIDLLEKEDRRKEKTAQRVANYRKRKKEMESGVTNAPSNGDCNADRNGYSNAGVPLSNATIPYHTNIDTSNLSIVPSQREDEHVTDAERMIDGIRERFGYYYYQAHPAVEHADRMMELISTISSVYAAGHSAQYTINGVKLGGDTVIAIFDQLTEEHLLYVLEKLDEIAPDVYNMRTYAIACLYNAPLQYNTDTHNQNENMRRFRAEMELAKERMGANL